MNDSNTVSINSKQPELIESRYSDYHFVLDYREKSIDFMKAVVCFRWWPDVQ